MFDGKTVLVTGGTGSFGKMFTSVFLNRFRPEKFIVFSRDEYKQSEMAKMFPPEKYPVRYFIGDVRDRNRLYRAFEGVDYVVHAAALKQVPALEYNPTEAVKTNVVGADNIVEAAVDRGVKKVVALSTDKAVNPINLYGATKLVAEKIFIAANAYTGNRTTFSVVRYGNVIGSRGSVIPLFLDLKSRGVKEFPITHEQMTRFWVGLGQGVELVLHALQEAEGGELFVPRIPSMRITDLARAVDPLCTFKIFGIRPGEKLHETLISEDEARSTKRVGDFFVVLPQFAASSALESKYAHYDYVKEGFAYRSDTNDAWLEVDSLRAMILQSA
ncbi:MAG: UDP-N-acetylglucosamine 4,6-dehydratase (inverting) [Elusimicrobia bacterium]|nr:UDP-N-acetylglucosamine 4,6-dehydratase (inverting) [Elusimicrobiota bacterium]